MRQKAPELRRRIKHLGAIVWSREEELGNGCINPFSALAVLTEEEGGGTFTEKLSSFA